MHTAASLPDAARLSAGCLLEQSRMQIPQLREAHHTRGPAPFLSLRPDGLCLTLNPRRTRG